MYRQKKTVLILCLVLYHVGCTSLSDNKTEEGETTFTEIEDNTIINLYDAFGENIDGLVKYFGFSCLVKFNGKTILFDGGTNADIFRNNVEKLNIDLSKVDFAIASHAHFDHINGFDYLLKVNPDVKIYFPADLFWGANIEYDISGIDSMVSDSLESRMQYFGGNFEGYHFNQTGRFWNADVEYVNESVELEPGIKLIVTKSSNMGYFNKYPNLESCENCESRKAKFNGLKEISLALGTHDGEVLFVGCSHSTVEKIIVEAKNTTQNEISLVYGGYHLLPYERSEVNELATRIKDTHKVKRVAPAHCTGHLAFKIFQDHYKEDYIFAGLGEHVRF